MSIIEAIKRGFCHGIDFNGRARRSEFWMFYLAIMIGQFIAIIIDAIAVLDLTHAPTCLIIVMFGTFLPYVACSVRRMHDVDRSGWWIFVPVAGFYFLFVEGTRGNNRFGPDPKSD